LEGAWEEVLQSIEWNKPRIIVLDISIENVEHQPQIKGRMIKKEAFKND
jgi:hypothetical protein